MKKLALLALVLLSCGPAPAPLPECPEDTIPAVCPMIGLAACSDGLTPISGCYVQAGNVRLTCVSSCN